MLFNPEATEAPGFVLTEPGDESIGEAVVAVLALCGAAAIEPNPRFADHAKIGCHYGQD